MEFEMKDVTTFSKRCYVTVNVFNRETFPEGTDLDALAERLNKLKAVVEEVDGSTYMLFYDKLSDYEDKITKWDEAHPEYRHYAMRANHTFEVSISNDQITAIHGLTRIGHAPTSIPTADNIWRPSAEDAVEAALARHQKHALIFKETLAAAARDKKASAAPHVLIPPMLGTGA